MSERIEWPPGSGDTADYTPDDIEFVQAGIKLAEAGEVDEAQLAREVGIFHDLKVLLDAKPVQ